MSRKLFVLGFLVTLALFSSTTQAETICWDCKSDGLSGPMVCVQKDCE